MEKIVIAAHKGGSGKTTVAVNLAGALANLGMRVLLVDTDPQGACAAALGLEPGKPTLYEVLVGQSQRQEAIVGTNVAGLSLLPSDLDLAGAEVELPKLDDWQQRLKRVLVSLDAVCDLAIIDTPGKSTDALIAAAKAANFVLMPLQPQLYDIETLSGLKDVLTLAGNPPSAVLVNRAPVQGKRHTETQEAAMAQGFKVCPVVIYARAAHGDAGNIGQTATEHEPKGKAAQEMADLYAYISIALKGGRHEEKFVSRRA